MVVFTEFKWKVDGFLQRFVDNDEDEAEVVWSEIFSLNDKPEAEFRVAIWNCDDISICCNNTGQTGKLKLVSKFWLESGCKKFCERVKVCVFSNNWPGFKYSETFLKKSDLADLKKFIVGGSVTICFKIKIGDSISEFDDKQSEQAGLDAFNEKIGGLRSEGHFDLTIQAGNKEFKALKHVLMSHSRIFKMMLSSPNSIEAQTSLIKIEDASSDVIEALVRWMHFLKVDNLHKISEDLYKVAHKYEISTLMKICIQSMCKTLKVRNLPSRIILAYTYNAEDLKNYIIRFVRKHPKRICALMTSDEWSNLLNENRELAKQIGDDIGTDIQK